MVLHWKKWLLQFATWASAQVFLLETTKSILFEAEVLCEYLPFHHTKYLNIKTLKGWNLIRLITFTTSTFLTETGSLFLNSENVVMKNMKIWYPCLHLC